ncbi:ExeA family protein [Qipengyuania vesicularis]|uniref:ExeA family protein n=1 Tax=Qipengyuania vesicularis TaxID=2867232 RepID=UPI001C87590D|nr:AAA family ATPase [Qipengyuania vesicularis]MBX7526925.1 AAA family ATPase [Qipengyuania vesicularis]
MYEEYYGFSERPFQLTPDPAFYFESVTHKKALSYLGYGLNQGEGFIVITGEVGAGKSILVGHLRGRLDWNAVTVGEVVTSALGSDEMISMAAHSFGLEVDTGDKAGALSAIEMFLQDEARAGRKVLLVIDEAQNLTVGALEELRMLSNFHLGAQPLLQMLLLGQPEFKQLLGEWDQLEQLRQRVIASHHLEAMQPGEIEPYVMHRLKHVGWDGSPRFDDGVWKLIQQETGGIPRKVNRLMSQLLMKGAMEGRNVIDPPLVGRVIDEMHGRVPQEAPVNDYSPQKAEPTRDAAPQDTHQAEARAAAQPEEPGLLDAQIAVIEEAFAQRDKIVASLRKEVAKLAQDRAEEQGRDDDARLAAIENRLEDQERTLRQVLTMMINYFESSASRDAA